MLNHGQGMFCRDVHDDYNKIRGCMSTAYILKAVSLSLAYFTFYVLDYGVAFPIPNDEKLAFIYFIVDVPKHHFTQLSNNNISSQKHSN